MPSQKELAFNQEAIDSHNSYRTLHGVGVLRLSEDCRKTAQDWAETLVQRPQLENSPVSCRGEVGENISSRTTTGAFCDLSGKEVSDQWYKDVSKYDFSSNSGNAGNFTQLVWAGSQEVGFGKAHHNGKCVVVAHYKPPGNMKGRYKDNVFRANTNPAVAAAARSSDEEPVVEGEPEAADMAPEEVVEEDVVAVQKSDSPVPKGKKTKTTVVTETVNEPNGKTYTVRREIEEYTDDFGNITERVKEIRLDDPDTKGKSSGTSSSSSDEEKDDKKEKKMKKKKTAPDVEGGEKKELNIFARDLLDSHNAYRKKHGCGPLTRNKELDKMAQDWAENLVRAERLTNSNCTYKGNRLGENIASRWSNGPCDSSGHEVTDHWYSEEKKFDYNSEPTNVQGIGNFTQLVWKNSKEIGVGKAIHTGADGTKVITVCLYHPAGNVLQCFCDNVCKQH